MLGPALAPLAGLAIAELANFPLAVNYRVGGAEAGAIAMLSIAIGLSAALRARRLTIVDALAGR